MAIHRNPIHFMFILCLIAFQSVSPAAAETAAPSPQTAQTLVHSSHDRVWVGWMELSGLLPDDAQQTLLVPDELQVSLRRVVGQLRKAGQDDQCVGVVIYLDEPELDLSQIDEIGQAMRAVRAAGRKVMVVAQRYDLLSYVLACSADQILLQHKGVIELAGLSVEELYLAGLLEKLGLKADLLQIGQFKGAQEPFTRSEPSHAWNQNIDALLDDLYGMILDRIAQGRGLARDQVEQLLAECWAMTDGDYVANGLVDQLTDRDLIDVTAVEFGEVFEWEDLLEGDDAQQNLDNPLALLRLVFKEPVLRLDRPSLAIVRATGPIVQGDSQIGGAFGSDMIGSRTVTRALRDAQDRAQIKGVVLRVDSPGGSALASEVIWQAVHQLSQTKPVYVSVGSTAASGGYYIACAGDQIYASPGSLVGSIGVVGGKIVLGNLYNNIGVSVYRRSRGPLGDMFNSVEPFTAQQHAALEAAFKRTYDQFTDRVEIGRGDRITDIQAVAQGRLFTGNLAMSRGMIDKLGGIETALDDLATQLGLAPGSYDIVHLPPPKSLSDVLEQWFRFPAVQSLDPSTTGMVKMALEPRGWREAKRVLAGLMLLRREPVLMLMPTAFVFR